MRKTKLIIIPAVLSMLALGVACERRPAEDPAVGTAEDREARQDTLYENDQRGMEQQRGIDNDDQQPVAGRTVVEVPDLNQQNFEQMRGDSKDQLRSQYDALKDRWDQVKGNLDDQQHRAVRARIEGYFASADEKLNQLGDTEQVQQWNTIKNDVTKRFQEIEQNISQLGQQQQRGQQQPGMQQQQQPGMQQQQPGGR